MVVATRHSPRAPSSAAAASVELPAPDLLALDSEALQSAAALTPAAPHAAVVRRAGPTHLATLAPPAAAEATREPAPLVAAAAEPITPHFTMLVAATRGLSSGGSSAAGVSSASAQPDASDAAPIAAAEAEIPAKLRTGTAPAYTEQALAAGVESTVPIELVVDANGGVASAHVLGRVGYGLDEAALRSVHGYRFTPARRGGRAVAVRLRWLMRFQLQ